MKLDELFEYKNKIMEILCSNEKIIKLITKNDNATIPSKTAQYNQIFPYEYIPETVDNATTFICFDVDVPYVENKTFLDPEIYIWVFTHKSNMKIEGGGVRIDDICVEINNELNGNREIGLGELDLRSVGRFMPIVDYQGRVLTYQARDFNRGRSDKNIPSNRRQ